MRTFRLLATVTAGQLLLSACLFSGGGGHVNLPIGKYVALGDSFSAGEGVPPFVSGTDVSFGDECHRSEAAYSMQLAALGGPKIAEQDFVACSGAAIADFSSNNAKSSNAKHEPPQEQRLGAAVELVTLSFGGNDLGFGDIIQKCLTLIQGTCHDTQDRSSPVYAGNITVNLDKVDGVGEPNIVLHPGKDHPRTLRDVYREIRMLAPKARILVLGYPHVFEENAKHDCAHFDSTDIPWANALSDRFDTTIRNNVAAAAAGIEYVQGSSGPDSLFVGHGLCTPQQHFNNPDYCVLGHGCLPNPLFVHNKEYLFHPDRRGQADYARAVMDQLKQPPPSAADVKFDQEASKICTAAALKNRMAVDTLVATFTYGDVGRVYSEELVTDAKEIVALRALAIPVGRAPSFNLAILAQRKADVDLDAVNVVISQQPSSSPYKLTNSLQLALQAFGRGAATANQVWQSAGLPECGSNKNG